MKLYRVTWYLSCGWSITGRVYASDKAAAVKFATARLAKESPQWAGLGEPEVSNPICEVTYGQQTTGPVPSEDSVSASGR